MRPQPTAASRALTFSLLLSACCRPSCEPVRIGVFHCYRGSRGAGQSVPLRGSCRAHLVLQDALGDPVAADGVLRISIFLERDAPQAPPQCSGMLVLTASDFHDEVVQRRFGEVREVWLMKDFETTDRCPEFGHEPVRVEGSFATRNGRRLEAAYTEIADAPRIFGTGIDWQQVIEDREALAELLPRLEKIAQATSSAEQPKTMPCGPGLPSPNLLARTRVRIGRGFLRAIVADQGAPGPTWSEDLAGWSFLTHPAFSVLLHLHDEAWGLPATYLHEARRQLEDAGLVEVLEATKRYWPDESNESDDIRMEWTGTIWLFDPRSGSLVCTAKLAVASAAPPRLLKEHFLAELRQAEAAVFHGQAAP